MAYCQPSYRNKDLDSHELNYLPVFDLIRKRRVWRQQIISYNLPLILLSLLDLHHVDHLPQLLKAKATQRLGEDVSKLSI